MTFQTLRTFVAVSSGPFVRRDVVPQADGGCVKQARLILGRLTLCAGIVSKLPEAPWWTRYIYAWRHPGVLYRPHWQARIWRVMVGAKLSSPND